MTHPDWQLLEEWFAKAVDLEGEARAAYLRERTGEDAALARELEGMLASHTESAAAFQQPIMPQLNARDRAGDWQLKEVLGEGGLGVVRRAERQTGSGIEQGAVKYVHAGYDTGAFRTRFLKERTILRTLEHASISRLLDGGVDEDGRPFLVMEFVDGLGWDRHLEEAKPPLTMRARLFNQLVSAVVYLHGRGVVHGDIKPSNVMVNGVDRVKLLDFGAARRLDPGGRPQESTFTRAMMTSGWASPEQMAGGACTPRSDIYSLGLMLRMALADYPEDADLCAIAEQATRQEPEERYGSALAMLDDVDRYLRQLPVTARRGNLWYRLRKFCRRNFMTLGLVICLSAACSGVLWLWRSSGSPKAAAQLPALSSSSPPAAVPAAAVVPAAVLPPPPTTEQVDRQLQLAYAKLNGGACQGVDPPLDAVRAAIPKLAPGRTRDLTRMRYLLLRGLCDARAGAKPDAADMLDLGFQLRDQLGAPDQLKPVFANRLFQLGGSFLDKGELERGAKLMHWAVVEAQRSGRHQEASRLWLYMLTRLSWKKGPGGASLLRRYCDAPAPGGMNRQAVAGVCAAPSAVAAVAAVSSNSVSELSRQAAALQARAAALTSQRKPEEAKAALQQRLELLTRLAELEPRNQRWRVMLRRSQNGREQ